MPLLIAAFILSGAAGLIYESIWSRYLGLFVGHSAYAQIIVLVIFLGGMSLGAWLVGERSQRIRHPLRAYALVELAAGLLGFAFHGLFQATSSVAYDALFPALAGGTGLVVVKWLLAGLLILPQSILLGTTFPLMTAGAIRLMRGVPGHTLSLMYFANSLGAAAGVLLAGFVLLSWGGLPGTLDMAGAINIAVAAMIFAGGRFLGWDARFAAAEPTPATATEAPGAAPAAPVASVPPAAASDGGLARLLLAVAFGTAVASFVYEIAWIRMLSLVLGSATHSFELMLSAFILGLALGAFWVRRHADRFADPVRALGIVQWIMGTLAIATLPIYLRTFDWMVALQESLALTDGGYTLFAVARYALCVLVMFPATICAGMTLPLITRILLASPAGERAIGRVYSVNTLGSILGVALAGLVLMPLIGLKWLLVLGALIDIALGIALVGWSWERAPFRHPRLVQFGAMASALFILAVIVGTHFDPTRLSSGVFRRGALPETGSHIIHHYVDGRTATVTVKQTQKGGVYTLGTNGKPDASISPIWMQPPAPDAAPIALGGDMSTQVLLALATIAHKPDARTGAVIGHGSGVTSHFLLASPNLRSLATIEIEPEMIAAARTFLPFNRRVYEDPRAQFVVDDAKSYFAAGNRKYDLILSEPSNPWVSGVSGLFTDEFYGRVRTHLTDEGVFGQWLHLYEIDDALVLSVLAALDRHFSDWALYFTASTDILVVAVPEGTLPRPAWGTVVAWPGVRQDLARVAPMTPELLDRSWTASRTLLGPMLQGYEPNTDYEPVLDLGTERTRYLRRRAEGLMSLHTRRHDFMRALTGDTLGFTQAQRAPIGDLSRVTGAVLGGRVRTSDSSGTAAPGSPVARAVARRAVLDAVLASNAPPPDWKVFYEVVADVESTLHMGTAGVTDPGFWAPIDAYMQRHGAPVEARAAVEMLHGLAAFDWPRVRRATPPLVAARARGDDWVNRTVLRDAVLTAHVRTGDPAGALAALRTLTDRSTAAQNDAVYDFRTRFWFWYLNAQVRPETRR